MKRKLRYPLDKFILNQYYCQQIVNVKNVKTERNFDVIGDIRAEIARMSPIRGNLLPRRGLIQIRKHKI